MMISSFQGNRGDPGIQVSSQIRFLILNMSFFLRDHREKKANEYVNPSDDIAVQNKFLSG
jgi:hypothetical protein